MRRRFDRTSGIALSFQNVNDNATLAAHASFDDLARSTVYLVVKPTGAPAVFVDKRSSFAPPAFVNRQVGIQNVTGRLFANLGRAVSLSTMVDAEAMPTDTWMQVAVSWSFGDMHMYKAPLGQPLKEVTYATYTFGAGASLDSDAGQPWTIGNATPGGSTPDCLLQHFRYYNELFEPFEIIQHQYEFGVARHQVVNVDCGVRTGTNLVEITRGVLAPITGAVEVDGIFVSEPEIFTEFTAAAATTLIGKALTHSAVLDRRALVA